MQAFALQLLALVAIIGPLVASPTSSPLTQVTSNLPKIFDYGSYVNRYGKSYSLTETIAKSKVFYAKTLEIFHHNLSYKLKGCKHYLRQNEFTDLTGKEIRRNYVSGLSDLEPVLGAKEYPDMPADRLLLSKGRECDLDGESRCSLADLGASQEQAVKESATSIHVPPLDISSDLKIEDIESLLKILKSNPVMADKMAALIDLKEGLKGSEIEGGSSNSRSEGKVKHKPVVASNNDNYDAFAKVSYGLSSPSSGWNDDARHNYAETMMKSLSFDFDTDPYSGLSLVDDTGFAPPPPTWSNIMDAAKFFFEVITHLGDGDEQKKQSDKQGMKSPGDSSPVKGIQYNVDWRITGCIARPRSQKSCDSCYAFAVTSMMEYMYCKQMEELTDFSPQYIIDCGQGKAALSGCKGGKITNVGFFIKEYGIELESMYPYSGKEDQCPYNLESEDKKKVGYLKPKITHWLPVKTMDGWYKWLFRSPLIVGINMPVDFFSYGGGIHEGHGCQDDMTHAMLLVGSGTEDGKGFWLLKNSYSTDWGEDGYFRLAQSAPLRCFNRAFVVRADFKVGK